MAGEGTGDCRAVAPTSEELGDAVAAAATAQRRFLHVTAELAGFVRGLEKR
jgi:hypothetical protein